MTKRSLWLGLIVLAQLSAGCCCWRQHCAGWRFRHCGRCATPTAGPVTGPGCSTCASSPVVDAGPAVAYGGPVVVPGGAIPLHAPTVVPGPTVTTPAPIGGGPAVTPVPNPMPPVKTGN